MARQPMNSSISTSEAPWRRLLRRYVVWSCGFLGVIAATIVAIDPYDTGRFAILGVRGVPHFGQRLTVASAARRPEFDIAIIGNSTVQLLNPANIDNGGSGDRAVSLAIPGTGPLEQLAVARWFLRNHANRFVSLIIGLDSRWCEARAPELTNPFPFWLYSANSVDYMTNLFSYQSLEAAARRVSMLLHRAKPAPTDGYNDYDIGHRWDEAEFRSRVGANTSHDDAASAEGSNDFPAASLLSVFLAELPERVPVLLVMPPQFRPALGRESTARALGCARAYRALADQRRDTRFINFFLEPTLTGNDEDYWDVQHYRSRVARVMEAEISTGLMQQRSFLPAAE